MEKVETVYCLVAVVLFDTIMHSVSTPMKFERSRLFGQRSHVSFVSIFSKGFSSETTEPI